MSQIPNIPPGTSYAAGVAQTGDAARKQAAQQDKPRNRESEAARDRFIKQVEQTHAPQDASEADDHLPDAQTPYYEKIDLREDGENPEAGPRLDIQA